MATSLKQEIKDRDFAATSPAPPPAKPGKRRIVLPVFLVLVALGGVWAFKNWNYGRTHASTDNAAVDGHLVPVLAKVSGYVQAVGVKDNDHVAADSLLVQIDPAEYQAHLAQAQADLAAAQIGRASCRERV